MKQSAKCVKCGGQEIIRAPDHVGAYGAGNNIRLGGFPVKRVTLTRYICAGCGYSEDWIDSQQDIDRVKAKFGLYQA